MEYGEEQIMIQSSKLCILSRVLQSAEKYQEQLYIK